MNVYRVHGIRHEAVIFANTPQEAVVQAIERGLVGDWEDPQAIHVPLPKGYRIVYDPVLASVEQIELPLSIDAPTLGPPHTITRSGIKVYEDWRDNIVVDADAPAVAWKADRDTFGTYTSVPGVSRLASENSEDALSWNLFRSLEKVGRLDAIARPLGLDDDFQVLYWHRPWDATDPLSEIRRALNRIEPWRKRKGHFGADTTIMLKGQRVLIMVEGHLGKPGAQIRPWERTGSVSVPTALQDPLRDLLVDADNWEETAHRFYKLLRHLILAGALCRSEVWDLEPHLLVIVNELNRHAGLRSHAQEFAHFRRCLRLPSECTHLVTWQVLLTQARATFDPGVRPLLAHAERLRYLQPPEEPRYDEL
jgi:hypothetical protein